MSDMQILNPEKTVRISSGEVVVRELAWPAARLFFEKLAGHASKLVKPGEQGKVTMDFAAIPGVVAGSEELSRFLLLKTTGKDEKWIEGLSVREGLLVLDAALEVNLSPEVLELGKTIAGRIGAAFGRTTKTETLPKPSIS